MINTFGNQSRKLVGLNKPFIKTVVCKTMFIFLAIVATFVAIVNSTSMVKADYQKENYIRNEESLINEELYGGVTLHKETAQTYSTDSAWHNQTVQWVDTQASYNAVSLVTWTYNTKHEWSAQTVTHMAQSWEELHPGYQVIAAVNGDFFNINKTGEPTNAHIQDGDFLGATNSSPTDSKGNPYRYVLGFKKDGTHIEGQVEYGSYELEFLDSLKNVEDSVSSVVTNSLPGDTGVGVYTTYFNQMKQAVDFTGYKVYECSYDLCRVSCGSEHNIFVKGSVGSSVDISGFDSTTSDYVIKLNNFYLVTKDSDVISKLDQGGYVRCQRKLLNEWSDVDQGFGYIYKILEDESILYDTVIPSTNGENSHPRTAIGFKEDGSTVLMVTDGRGGDETYRHGTSYKELAALLKDKGCTSAYNLDGGGSSELIVRDAYGQFSTINTPSDKSSRCDGNAVLLVMKDPGFTCVGKDSTRFSLQINRKETLYSTTISNIVVTIGDKSLPMTSSSLTFDGLKENTAYDVVIEYDETENNVSKHNRYLIKQVKTKAFTAPDIEFAISDVTWNQFMVTNNNPELAHMVSLDVSEDSNFTNPKKYLATSEKVEVFDLNIGKTYYFRANYEVIDPVTSNTYTFVSDTQRAILMSSAVEPTDTEVSVKAGFTSIVVTNQAIKTFKNAVVHFADNEKMENATNVTANESNEYIITDLIQNKKYYYTITFDYYDNVTYKTYTITTNAKLVSTKRIPTIDSFEVTAGKKDLTVTYYVEDPQNENTKLWVSYQIGEKIYETTLESLAGETTFKDFAKKDNIKVWLNVSYMDDASVEHIIKSEVKCFTVSGCGKVQASDLMNLYAFLSIALLAYALIKKRGN